MSKININKNIYANYIGQGYVMLVSIIITPLYLKYMGAESYGLIGFFIMMQVWLNLLDVGLSPTLGRQVAYARGQLNGFNDFQKILKSFETFFLILSLVAVISIYFTSDWIAQKWIQSETLDKNIISYCIFIMGVIISLRWFATLYRSGLNGFEDQIWLNKINIVVTSFKYVGALLYLILISTNIKDFFEYQLIIGILEFIILSSRFYFNLYGITAKIHFFGFDWISLKAILPFSLNLAYTTIIWTFLMQLDKLILSGILSLKDFGYLSIVTLISSGIIALSTPIFLAIVPRMTKLASENKQNEVILMYRNMTQFVTWIVLSFSLMAGIFSKEIIYILTGDINAALWGKDILFWFILGYGMYVLGTFQYYLQNVLGNLNLYAKGLTVSALIYIPMIYFITINYGAIGAGIGWFVFSVCWFIIFTGIVHKKFLSNFHLKWIVQDLLPLIIPSILLSYLLAMTINFDISQHRMVLLFKISIVGLVFISLISLGVKSIREKLKNYLHYNINKRLI